MVLLKQLKHVFECIFHRLLPDTLCDNRKPATTGGCSGDNNSGDVAVGDFTHDHLPRVVDGKGVTVDHLG
jgi:hypothetical protein